MQKLHTLVIAAVLAAPLPALAQVYRERITVYDNLRYQAFVIEQSGAIQSGANNLADTLLADEVAMAIADDARLRGATVTVSAHQGRVSLSGSAKSPEQSTQARQVAQKVAGLRAVTGELSSTGG